MLMSVGHELLQKRAERQLSVERLAAITKSTWNSHPVGDILD
jgi:hypothetical protein